MKDDSKNAPFYSNPFLWTAACWLLSALVISLLLGGDTKMAFLTAGIWALCVTNLIFLGKTVASVLGLMSYSDRNTKIAAFVWAGAKFTCLGVLIWVLSWVDRTNLAPVLLGTATLLVVPLVGGIFWRLSQNVDGRKDLTVNASF
jgi:hypothetical protein